MTTQLTRTSIDANEYQAMYGEPPPSYKMAKYYPKAISTQQPLLATDTNQTPVATKTTTMTTTRIAMMIEDVDNVDDDDKTSHIYENIDELTGRVISGRGGAGGAAVTGSKRRRSRFSGLKKVFIYKIFEIFY